MENIQTGGQVEVHRHFTGQVKEVKMAVEVSTRDTESRLAEQGTRNKMLGSRNTGIDSGYNDFNGAFHLILLLNCSGLNVTADT